MGRILAIDYGRVRTGLAVTDPLKIIASALETVPSKNLFVYLENYFITEKVDQVVVGLPVNLKSEDTDGTQLVRNFAEIFIEKFPSIPLTFYDERFTSKMAIRVMIDSGMSKKNRRIKGNVDQISAVIILQDFMSKTK